jgi:hypothetical protein
VYRIKKLKSGQGPKGCRSIEGEGGRGKEEVGDLYRSPCIFVVVKSGKLRCSLDSGDHNYIHNFDNVSWKVSSGRPRGR